MTPRNAEVRPPCSQETHLPEGLPGLSEGARELALRCPDQLAPFTGVFGCDPLNGWQTKSRKGTLFRLPLRTREAAARSKIKDGKGGAPRFDDVMRDIIEPFLYQRSKSSEDGEKEFVLVPLGLRTSNLRRASCLTYWGRACLEPRG